jgi:hypothetical protein
MRELGLGLVVLSMVFGAGGVSLHASDGRGVAAKGAGEAVDDETCTAPGPSVHEVRLHPKLEALQSTHDLIPLNTRGMNYPRAEDYVPAAPEAGTD